MLAYMNREAFLREPGTESFCVESSIIVISRLYLSQTIRNLLILGIASVKIIFISRNAKATYCKTSKTKIFGQSVHKIEHKDN